MIEYLPQALSQLDTALKIGRAIVDIRDTTKAQDELLKFQKAILEAQSQINFAHRNESSLLAKINELEKECMRLKDFEAEKQNYSRKEIATGIFAYVANDVVTNFENAHKYCCNCFDNHIKSTLQRIRPDNYRMGLSCHKGCPDLGFADFLK